MARQVGTLKFTGSIGELNFYYTANNGWIVRKKSSLDAHRVKTDPAFERSRENSANFANTSSAARCLRHTFRKLYLTLSDSKLCPRSCSLMHQVKKHDSQSPRGKASTEIALLDPKAQALLRGFSFNDGPSVSDLLLKAFDVDLASAVLSIQGLNPGQDLLAPASATHVGFSSAYARINFREQEKSSFSEELLLALDGNITDLVLTTPPVPELEGGISILVLKIVFYQEINNSLNLLNDKNHCAIEIISAGFPA